MNEVNAGEIVLLDEALSDQKEIYVNAGQGRRLANYIIDTSILVALRFCMALALFLTKDNDLIRSPVAFLVFTLALYISYFLVMESTTTRTVGKLFTGTRVISDSGEPPTFNQILILSLIHI
jgi:uncharacterized RDD family membrane protein YckC